MSAVYCAFTWSFLSYRHYRRPFYIALQYQGKETSAGHEKLNEESKESVIATVFNQKHHHKRDWESLCASVTALLEVKGEGERGSHDWMMLPSNQAEMIVLTRRAPPKTDVPCRETFQVGAGSCKCKTWRYIMKWAVSWIKQTKTANFTSVGLQ